MEEQIRGKQKLRAWRDTAKCLERLEMQPVTEVQRALSRSRRQRVRKQHLISIKVAEVY